jgi:predicted RNA-binding Zn-ribbon protein involved in translation (DUF1610 family)
MTVRGVVVRPPPNCIICGVPLEKTGKMFGEGTMQPQASWMPEWRCPECGNIFLTEMS